MIRESVLLSFALMPAWAVALCGELPVVENPRVWSDQSVDCSTIERSLKSLIKEGMTDEQKVLACYHWIRRVLYHGDGPIQYAYNFHNLIHIFGNGSCLRQTTPLWVLLDKLGFKCRTGAVGGHHIIEVQYGGKWHLFDPHTNFFVYDREKPAAIASIEQIQADPTLVTDAVKEGRTCPGFLLCGDSQSMFADVHAYQIVGDFPEAKKYTPVIEEPFGRITLPRGSSYVCTWMPGKYWFKANSWKKDQGPSHGCGMNRDAKDSVNFPLYEPHAANRTYRHCGAGYLAYKPDLSSDHYTDAVVEQKNVAPGKKDGAAGLVAQKAGEPGEITFSVNCPYVITAGELNGAQFGPGLSVAVSNDQGKTWKPVELKTEQETFSATFVDEVNGSFKGYWLKLTLPAGSGITKLELTSHFQLNPYSLPYLVPGKNVVSAEAGRFGTPLTVTWKWAEGENWKEPKSASKSFVENGSFEVEVAGPKYPRMESLSLQVAP